MIGIGLIGAGRIGTLHAKLIHAAAGCRVVSVFDEKRTAADQLAAAVDATPSGTAAELVNHPNVDAVFICSPTDTHVDMVAVAAKAGKAIFCEKPIDLKISRVVECARILERCPVPFTVGFHRRFDPHHRSLREEVQQGRIGNVEQIRIVSRDPAPPPLDYVRRSGGIFRDMMIHDLDQCRFILRQEIVRVFATGCVLIDQGIQDAGDFDTATAILWTASGATCAIQNSRRCTYGFDQRIEVFGSTGSISLENVTTTRTAISNDSGRITRPLPRHFPERYHEAYSAQLAAFVEALARGARPQTTVLDGLWSLAIADAADLSARTGSTVEIRDPMTSGC